MRKKTQVSIRLEWIAAMAHLASEARHEVPDAVIAYLTDGTVADVPQEGAAVFGSIRADIDRREEKHAEPRVRRAARATKKAERERAAQTETPIPGYLPALPTADLEERAERCEEFSYFDKPLLRVCLENHEIQKHPLTFLQKYLEIREITISFAIVKTIDKGISMH